ncbi:hypothetical protein ODJ79_42235 [Actinoplanes sp. KI2]|uniref:hypothetical protein n=1 Tax=Actinoplanes sp. KI2 TaxID=2983315 RepID=UPI0021D5996F|nr:hypothetical protein [Actinoplanes sp. KI2]MCU7730378.1 hypothetical protein [Actinoplanes sp. KI2]
MTPVTGSVTRIRPCRDGYEALLDDRRLVARHVILASGGTRRDRPEPGVVCARRFTGAAPGTRTALVVAPPSATRADELPTTIWVLPGERDDVTVGVAAAGGADPATLLDQAAVTLGKLDSGLAGLAPAGPATSGALHSWFTPAAVHEADCLLVGDAAGLANPFTGEGLGYAVHSGLLAAEAIAGRPDDPVEARREYANRIAAAAVGYFEAARHAARRYHLVWRMLSDSAGNDHPLIAKARRAILLPRATGPAPARAAVLGPSTAFLVACDGVALSAIRERWPFLARLVASGEGLVQRELRLATLLLAGLSAEGAQPGRENAAVGAAVELAGLSALAFVGNAPPPGGRPGVPWGLAATVLTADFLLAEASRLVADAAPRLARPFAEWLGDLTALRADRLAGDTGVPATAVFGALFEFPARVGAWLGECSDGIVSAMRDIGELCGAAFLYGEDLLALRGEPTRLETSWPAMLAARMSAVPDLLPGRGLEAGAVDESARVAAIAALTAAGRSALEAVTDRLAAVPGALATRVVQDFAATVAAPINAGNGDDDGRGS